MRIVSFGEPGGERVGVLADDSTIAPLAVGAPHHSSDFHNLLSDPAALRRAAESALLSGERIPAGTVRLGPPVPHPGKIIGVGFNYLDHSERVLGASAPANPVLFLKPWNALVGHSDPILKPFESNFLDYEVELAVVIGTAGHRFGPDEAAHHIAGYLAANDVTSRDIAVGEGFDKPLTLQITKAKGYRSFCPVGPWMLTADEVDPLIPLELTLSVNGEMRQHSDTSQMIVNVPSLLSHVSQAMPLDPGDIILTGTPKGCGFEFDPPKLLNAGDIVEASISRLGSIVSRVENESH